MSASVKTAPRPRAAEGSPQRLLLLGFPQKDCDSIRGLCGTGGRYQPFSRLSGAELSQLDREGCDVAALYLAGSGLDDLAYLMRLSSHCATVVVSSQTENEVAWLRLVNTVVPVAEFSPERLLLAADEAQLRRRHQYAGVVTADALHSLRQTVGAAGTRDEAAILIADEHGSIVFANAPARALGDEVLKHVVGSLRGGAAARHGEQTLTVPELLPQPLSISTVALEEHGQPLNVLRIERAGGSPIEALMQHLALIDTQTGLPNRAHFLTQVDHAATQCGDTPARIALMIVQLERPRAVTTELDPDATARLRRIEAERLRECLRTDDVVARLGGDTFGVLLRGFNRIDDLLRPAHRLMDTIAAPYLLDGKSIPVIARMGASVYPEDGRSAKELLHHADRALSKARGGKSGTFEFFQPELGQKIQRRWRLESRLPLALHDHCFTVNYQPLVDPSGKILGAEALARWADPELGQISPVEFIPMIEELRLMNELSLQIWGQAFEQLRRWREGVSPALTLSINVSAAQFLWPGFIGNLESQLNEAGVPPHAIELEITEGLLIEDHDLTRMVLHEAAALGVRVYLDDFGTGYSSLGYLVDLPVAGIKVDRRFCSGLPDSQKHVAMTVTILTLARYLNLDVLVEGVETKGQARFLANHKVPRMQGFLYGKPVPADDFTKLLEDGGTL